ncbi:MAG TPA: hypothetical protein VMV94_07030 [Phycisphaerae bacterium]|nr:hypothetical protein [Phycisphaerae bacterium]
MMCDAKCKKCGRHFGWSGSVQDAPSCPRCGAKLSQDDLEHDQAVIDEFRQFLRERPARTGAMAYWNRARFAAGLSTGQAAGLLGVPLSELVAINEGRADPLPAFAAQMRRVYLGLS